MKERAPKACQKLQRTVRVAIKAIKQQLCAARLLCVANLETFERPLQSLLGNDAKGHLLEFATRIVLLECLSGAGEFSLPCVGHPLVAQRLIRRQPLVRLELEPADLPRGGAVEPFPAELAGLVHEIACVDVAGVSTGV